MATPNMNLTLPIPNVTSGTWGDILNAAFDLVDAHDHTPGFGVRVPVDGLDATGTPGATNFLRGDGSWQTPSVDVSQIVATGTPGPTTFLRGDGVWQEMAGAGGAGTAATSPLTMRTVAAVDGVDTARLIGLRSIAKSQAVFGGLPAVAPGASYPYVFIRDLVYMSDPYPGFFTAAYLRPILDTFVSTIGGDPFGYTEFSAEHIDLDGTVRYRPGPTENLGKYPTYDNGPFLVLLAAQVYDRGDRTVYSLYKTQMLQVLAASPRDGSGRIYSDPSDPSVGWGFEDLQNSANKGGLGMATAYHILAYQKLASMAALEGDTATAVTATAAASSLIAALATLRRVDGYYSASTYDTVAHVMLTAMVVFFGWDTLTNLTVSANAMLADYREVSAYSGDAGSVGGNISQRGGIRHIVYPNFFLEGSVPNNYQNGPAWLGPWVGWVAYTLSLVDVAAGRELLQSAVNETIREQRVSDNAPWEWTYNTVLGSVYYGAAAGFLGYAVDAATPQTWTVSGVNASTATLRLPYGTNASRFTVTAEGPSVVTVALAAARETNTVADANPLVAPSFGAESAVTSVALATETSKTVSGIGAPSAWPGGFLRATVSAGSAAGNITIAAQPMYGVPTMASGSTIIDDYTTDKLATDYTVTGAGWSVAGGVLINNDTNDALSAIWTTNGAVTDIDLTVTVSGTDLAARYPAVILRSSADALDGVVVMVSNENVTAFDRLSGSMFQLGLQASTNANNTPHTLRVRLVGAALSVWLNGAPMNNLSVNVGKLTGGYFGPYLGSLGAGTLTWDNLALVTGSNVVPPGYLLTNSVDGFGPGEPASSGLGATLRNPAGAPVGFLNMPSVAFSFT